MEPYVTIQSGITTINTKSVSLEVAVSQGSKISMRKVELSKIREEKPSGALVETLKLTVSQGPNHVLDSVERNKVTIYPEGKFPKMYEPAVRRLEIYS